MIFLNGIKGQDNALRYLKYSVEKGRIPTSYLFSGPKGVGRALSARSFIRSLICKETAGKGKPSCRCSSCIRINSGEHPDMKWIRPEKNRNIKIEEIRALKDFVSLRPFESSYNCVVVEDAHMMTPEASNALLKVLEEPPGNTVIILISDKKELLLTTVVSRCSEVRFVSLSAAETKSIIKEVSGMDDGQAAVLAYFSQGSPGVALEMAAQGHIERRAAISELLRSIHDKGSYSLMEWDVRDKDPLMDDIETLIMILRDTAFRKEGLEDMVLDSGMTDITADSFPDYSGIEDVYDVISELLDIKLALSGNVNPKIAAQILPGYLKRKVPAGAGNASLSGF